MVLKTLTDICNKSQASGQIGKIILDSLVDSSLFSITAVSRKESTATFPPNVTVRKIDFVEADLTAAFQGQDVVISVVGIGGLGEQKKLVDAVVRAGVKRFFPSEFSASTEDSGVRQLLPPAVQKTELLEYLKAKEADGLTWTGIASSLLFDWCLRNGFLEFDIAKRTATVWDGGDKKFTLSTEKQLGQAVVSALQHPQETSNQYMYIASFETSQKEILAVLEEETGAEWKVTETTTDEQVAEGLKKIGAGDFRGAYPLVRATSFGNSPGLQSNYVKDQKLANDVLGLQLENIRDIVKQFLNE
ncbi:hypothetical protein AJ79_01373 [Helicocarpus griseus UAMH5409]|uniref:NmrA-like domain-containing protein n=1 Tax=Helicocarpus griseus UAMH5409 TaxID=1447875 RepID=A0A2B7Y7B4_9EURO|nr:hypothetical protein AJ79_01373 [Helicocarpus griseus UAMH5409]